MRAGRAAAAALAALAALAGAAEAAGVRLRVEIPDLCLAEHRPAAGRVAIWCLHPEGAALVARHGGREGVIEVAFEGRAHRLAPGERREIGRVPGPVRGLLAISVAGPAEALEVTARSLRGAAGR